ncbi:MAG: NAD(P)-dependent oxidoreductase [Betaproteobacteria bacterium]|nr:NAD(P)-dependent oxidoreductase [Betaproteobacteria bacterium]
MKGATLITGANSFLGSRLIDSYCKKTEIEIIAVWRSRTDRLQNTPPSHIHYVQCDLSNREELEALFNRWNIERVFHAAALLPDEGADFLNRLVSSNIIATANLVELAAKAGCTRFVYCSSISVYGSAPSLRNGWKETAKVIPTNFYGLTKHAGEECLRLTTDINGLSGVSLRLAGIHGRGRYNGVIFDFKQAALNGIPLIVNEPNNCFQVLFIEDAVEICIQALERDFQKPYSCFNTASHVFPTLYFIAEKIVERTGSKSQIRTTYTNKNQKILMNTEELERNFTLSPSSIGDFLDDLINNQQS